MNENRLSVKDDVISGLSLNFNPRILPAADGNCFADNTLDTVSLFEKNNDLPVDGVADAEMQGVLFSDSAVGEIVEGGVLKRVSAIGVK